MKTQQQKQAPQMAAWKRVVSVGVTLSVLAACGTVSETTSDSSSTESTDLSSLFPSSLAVTSPLSVSEESSSASASKSIGTGITTEYSAIMAEIEAILSGTTPASCDFDPAGFLVEESNADCYGPVVDYVGHPDAGSGPSSGELPPGDVGIWLSTDVATGHACVASQLDARIEGMQQKSLAGLESMASILCVISVNGLTMPSNSTLDVATEMTALDIADVTINQASLTHDDSSGSDEYSYTLDLTYAPGGTSHPIVVRMTHIPTVDPEVFQGRVTYLVNDTSSAGNCPSADITHNGSLLYNATAADDMALEMRTAEFCGAAVDGTVDGLVNPADKYDAATNVDGWGNSFTKFIADFDPTTLTGNYTFSWQAGPEDGYTRVFNLVADGSSGSIPSATAFFGFGDDVDGSDGSLAGYICNWAGPGNTRTVLDYAQEQDIMWDTTSSLFVVKSEQIDYAVTNACTYDGLGSFQVDSDSDGTVDTDVATAIANDLQALTDADVDGTPDEIEAVFMLPTPPSNI